MTVNEEFKAERDAARLEEAYFRTTEYAALAFIGGDSYGYGLAAGNVRADALDRWAERMGV